MLRHWLTRWDRRLALRIGPPLPVRPMEIGFDLAFPEAGGAHGIDAFLRQAALVTAGPETYFGRKSTASYRLEGGQYLRFASAIATGDAVNDVVWARVLRSYRKDRAILVVRHWSAPDQTYLDLAAGLRALGFTTVLLTLPHHGRRQAPGTDAGEFLSANLGKTVRAVRQAVVDARHVIDWLAQQGFARIAVIGASLGSCVASIVAALDERVDFAGLLLTAGDFGKVVWTGSATQHIRRAFEPELSMAQVQAAWQPISTTNYVGHLRARRARVQIVSAQMDTVILPHLTREFCEALEAACVSTARRILPGGHHTLGAFPFNLLAFSAIAMALRRL